MTSRKEYVIGRGRPPKHTQWKKGQSGNPSGRPKGRASFMGDVVAELETVVSVNVGGRKRRLSQQQLSAKQLVTKAAKGDIASLRLLIAMLQALADQEAGQADFTPPPAPLSPDEEKAFRHFVERHKAWEGQTDDE